MKTKDFYKDRSHFTEDMSRKKRWFYELRGEKSDEEFDQQIKTALNLVEKNRNLRGKVLDPGGGTLEKEAEFTGKSKKVTVKKTDNPKEQDSKNFVSHCFHVESKVRFLSGSIRFKAKRGTAKKFELQTARVFVYDVKKRQWNLVDNSGYNEKEDYLFSSVFRSGIYVAIALPKDKKDIRDLALMRFSFLNMKLGIDTGMLANAREYFVEEQFRKLAYQVADANAPAEERDALLKQSLKIYKESKRLRDQWPNQFAFNGIPEWHIIEDMEDHHPEWIERLGLDDIVLHFPFLIRLANRVGRWYNLGPYNINGRVKSLVIHPTNGDILYAGAANGGIWKTTNGGDTWKHLWKFEDTMAIGSLAISKSSPATLYAATGEYTPSYGPSYRGTGIFKSTNSGDTWTNVALPPEVGPLCSKIDIHPTNPDIVYVATNTGVYKTVNGGANWNRVLNGGASDLVIDADNPDTVYAGIHNNGLYKTTNGGNSWDRFEDDLVIIPIISWFFPDIRGDFPQNADAGWIKIAMGKNGDGGTGFLAVKLGQNGERILATGNGGNSWYPLPETESVSYNEWCTLIAVHPNDHKCIYAGGVGLDYTHDGFNFHNTTGTWADHHMMVFHPSDDDICYVCCDGGVYRSANKGISWTLKSRYLIATQLMSLGVANQGTFVAGSATQDQGIIQTEGSPDWDNHGGGNEWGMFVVDPNNSENIYISPGAGFLRRSTDRGRNYTTLDGGLRDWWSEQDRNTRPANFAHVAVRTGNSNILTGVAQLSDKEEEDAGTVNFPTKRRVYYSSNQGDSWSIALDLGSSNGTRVAYAPSNGNIVYVGTDDGQIFKSSNGGQSGWTNPYTSANQPPVGIISSITVEHNDPDTIYITYGNFYPNVHRSVNGGQSWTPVSGAHPTLLLPNIAVTSLVIDHEDEDILYVGTDIGVFRSNDAGFSWYFYNDSFGEFDLPKVLVTGLAMHKSTNRLFASTMGRGLYYTYTSGLYSLRVLEISHYFRGHEFRGIQYLKVTDGSQVWVMSRNEVIRRIEAGTNFYTIGADGSRAEVIWMQPDSQHPLDYVKTTPDETLADNLLSLPEFYYYS